VGLKLYIPKAFMTTFFSVLYQFLLRFSRTHNARVDTQILEYNAFFEGYIVRTSQLKPESSPSFLPTNNTQAVDLARRSNLLRMFRLRWTAGDDQLPFNPKMAGGVLASDEKDKAIHYNNVKNEVKIPLKRSAGVLDTLNAFLWH